MRNHLFIGAAVAALSIPSALFAQSSGTISAEEDIVVTGTTTRGLEGVVVPDTPLARTILSNEYLTTQVPGQSVLQSLNIVPSVNFTNNDPFGSSGGNIRIRGFDGNRISLTFDGLPLNDTGNYAIFSNQQLDPEVIEQVNVNQGTTDVDSPTAASSGGTINYRSLNASEEPGVIVNGTFGGTRGSRYYMRAFGLFQTGEILNTGIRGWASVSKAIAEKWRGPGEIDKTQFNAKLIKEFGANGDFVSLAGHYNKNRNAFFRQLTLAQAQADLRDNGRFDFDNNPVCTRPTFGPGAQNEASTQQLFTAVPGATSVANPLGRDTSCTNYFGVRLNPSNTGNVRLNSKWTVAENIVFTFDAGYQYVLANGGGFTANATQASSTSTNEGGFLFRAFNSRPAIDVNGDGDASDTIAFYTPNNTNTNRFTVLSSLRWDFAPEQSIRIAYAFDYGRHRQTGEWTSLDAFGNPRSVFGGRGGARVFDANGYFLRQRDRFSIAMLNQISGEYRGSFLNDSLDILLGVRAPFFKRELDQNCFTQASNGFALCTSAQFGTTPITAAQGFFVIPANFTGVLPSNAVFAPFEQDYKYDKILPNVGFTFRPIDNVSVYASYAKGLSAPRTDNLYRTPFVDVAPETTDNFDVGLRYNTSIIQASLGGFYNRFKNRIVTSFDQDQGISIDRNVGKVEIKGLEASLDVRPYDFFTFRGFASYIDAQYKDDLAASTTLILPIRNKKLVETPEWQYGYRAVFERGPVQLGLQFKHVDSRFATDLNDLKVPGYDTFDVDARVSLAGLGLEKAFVQLNVQNLFDEKYLGSISTQISQPTYNGSVGPIAGLPIGASIPGGSNPNFQPGSPRSFTLTVQMGF